MTAQGVKRAAHRPSRRREIIEAATVVFAREGYAEANVEDIAQAAGVAPTAIYYHFGGKEELFAQALRAALNGFSDRIFQVRPDTTAGSVESLRTVVRAGWDFWYAHPDAARLVMRYSEGSTAHALQLRREWELRHLERAYDYVPEARASRSTRRAREQHAAHTLAIGVLLDTVLVSQAAALDGAFGRLPRGPLVGAVEEMCVALILSLR
jgi:AcrR family transcriptional regulator